MIVYVQNTKLRVILLGSTYSEKKNNMRHCNIFTYLIFFALKKKKSAFMATNCRIHIFRLKGAHTLLIICCLPAGWG